MEPQNLPQYINCFDEEYVECFYYLRPGCQETCEYAIQRNDLGMEGVVNIPEERPPTVSELEQEFEER